MGGAVGTGGTGGAAGGGGVGGSADLDVCGTLGWAEVNALALSHDGTSVAMAGETVKLFDVATRSVQRTFVGLTNDATSVAISPDGTQIAASSFLWPDPENHVHLVVWRAADASVVWTQRSVGVYSVAYSPDGQLLAIAGYDSTVALVSTATWQPVRVYTGHQSPVAHVVFSPDGSLIASTDTSATVKIWQVADLVTKETLQGSKPISSFSAAFSPDGTQLLSSVVGARIRVSDGIVLQSGLGGPDAFSPDGLSFIAGSLYRMSDGTLLRSPPGNSAVAYLPDSNHALIVPSSGIPTIWSIIDGTTGGTFTASGLQSAIAVVSTDGTQAFVGNQMFSLPSGNLLYQSSFATTATGYSAAFSPDGTLVATTTTSNGLSLMNAADGSLNSSVPAAHAGVIRTVAFSPAGDRIATCSDDHLVKIWSTAGLTPLETLGGIVGHTTGVTYVTWSPDGSEVASVGGSTTLIWQVATGAISQTLNVFGLPVFSSDGSTLMMFGPDVIQSFDVMTGQPVGIIDVPDATPGEGPVVGRPLTPDQGIVVGPAALYGVDLWSLPQGLHVTTLPDPSESTTAYFTSSGLVTFGTGKLVVWCPASGGGAGMGGSGGGTEPIATACSGAASYVADFDGDGIVDCATSPGQGELDFHKGVDGTLVQSAAVVSIVGCLPTSSAAHATADMNGDGRADLVFVVPDTGGNVSYPYDAFMIAGRYDGTFRCSPDGSSRVGSTIAGVGPVIGDYEGGPGATVLLAGFVPSSLGNNNQVQLVMLNGTRTTTALSVQLYPVEYSGYFGSITSLAGPDLNGDGHTDVVLNVNNRPECCTGPVPATYTYYGDGNGTLSTTPP